MAFPKKITPSPLREAVVEIRFDTDIPSDAVFGLIYSSLRDVYPNVDNLPILQIPELLRKKDDDLVFQPHYKLKRDNFIAQIGPRVFALSMTPPLSQWSEFLPELLEVFERVRKVGIISKVSRFGLRYINGFDGLLFEKLAVKLTIMDRDVRNDQVYIRNIFSKDEFTVLLQLVNSSKELRSEKGADKKMDSAIDTDVQLYGDNLNFFEDIEGILNRAHDLQQEVFFGLLQGEILESFSPEY